MTIEEIVQRREIQEVLHFTTTNGLVGILDSWFLRSRKQIIVDERVEFILKKNSEFRKDVAWLDYVNLSVSAINTDFFSASKRWHPDISWRVLSFSPEILSHEGVFFTTTNNIYPSAERAQGAEAFERMFSPTVAGRYGKITTRDGAARDSVPTDCQAEVLYPSELSLGFLARIYVMTEDDQDQVYGVLQALGKEGISVEVCPKIFGEN